MRDAAQVARRAVAMTALAFRASMEVTDHPRSAELSRELPKWLEFYGADSQLMPLEHELLNTPYGQLDGSQSRDAHWSGEGAWILAWAIGLVELPSDREEVDYRLLFKRLGMMRSEVRETLTQAMLRPDMQLINYCVAAWALRSELQLRRLEPDKRSVLAALQKKRLEEIGLVAAPQSLAAASELVDGLNDQERKRAASLAFLREHAAFWLFNNQPTYFQS